MKISTVKLFSSSINRQSYYDLVVSGGGMVGLALAAAVGQTPLMNKVKVLVIDGNMTLPRVTHQYSNRVCALSLGTVSFLKDIGIWSGIESVRVKPFTKIHVWDACSNAAISFSNDDSQLFAQINDNKLPPEKDIIGYIVENNVIHKSLCDRVENCDIDVHRGVVLKAIDGDHTDAKENNPLLSLSLSNDMNIKTKLLVGADGYKSQVRQMSFRQQPLTWNYDQHAVVATLGIEEGLMKNDGAWQRFLPNGTVALLPLSEKFSSLVWSTTPDHAKELLQMTPDLFVNAVNTALFGEYPIHKFVSLSDDILSRATSAIVPSAVPVRQYPPTIERLEDNSRAMFPLGFLHSPQYVKSRIALIGDAAHRVHPLAGLGVNLGLNDVAILYKELLQSHAAGGDWGNLTSLLSYEKQSQFFNLPLMAAIDGLQKLFTTSAVPIVAIRSLGLQMTAISQPIKDYIFSQAQR